MTPLTFYDSVSAAAIPADARAVAGYVDGRWPSLPAIRARFPRLPWLSIATSPTSSAMVLDVEHGDATLSQATGWIRRQRLAGVARPCIYCSLSTVPALQDELRIHVIHRNSIRLWTAHWTGRPHLCDVAELAELQEPPGATQYLTNPIADWDVSLTSVQWFEAVRRDFLGKRAA